MIENVVIYVNDIPYNRWKNLTISYSLNSVTSTATFSSPDHPDHGVTYWLPQSRVRITANGADIFNGHIYKNESVVNSRQIGTTLTARSFGAVVSDSSPPMSGENAPIRVQGYDLDQLLRVLIDPYCIEPRPEIQGTPPDTIKYPQINPLSTVERELNNALLSVSGTTVAPTKSGSFKIITNAEYEIFENQISNSLKTARFTADDSSRFHTYEAISATNVRANSSQQINQKSSVEDNLILGSKRLLRKRVPGSSVDVTQEYAQWMKNVSYGRSRKLNVMLVGWRPFARDLNGELIQVQDQEFFLPGQVHRLNQDARIFRRINVEGEWLIDRVQFSQKHPQEISQNTGGTTCTLDLIKPEAYLRDPVNFLDPVENSGDVAYAEEVNQLILERRGQ